MVESVQIFSRKLRKIQIVKGNLSYQPAKLPVRVIQSEIMNIGSGMNELIYETAQKLIQVFFKVKT